MTLGKYRPLIMGFLGALLCIAVTVSVYHLYVDHRDFHAIREMIAQAQRSATPAK